MNIKEFQFNKIFLFLFILSFLIFAFWTLLPVKGSQQHKLFFQSGDDFFRDYFNVLNYTSEKNVYTGDHAELPSDRLVFRNNCWDARFLRAYPTLAYSPMVYANHVKVTHHQAPNLLSDILGYYGFILCAVLFALLLNSTLKFNAAIKSWFIVTMFSSGIYLFSLERGNIILLASLLSAFFIFNYKSENKLVKELALLALAGAAGIKLAPAILGCLLLYEKDWKAAIRVTIYGILAFFLPFLLFEGHFKNVFEFMKNMHYFSQMYFANDSRCMCEQYGLILSRLGCSLSAKSLAQIFFCISLISGCCALFLSVFEKKQWRRVFLLSFTIILFPTVSHRYCLLYLLPCMVLFFNTNDKLEQDLPLTILLACLCSPLQIFVKNFNIFPIFISLTADFILIILLLQSFVKNIIPSWLYIRQNGIKMFFHSPLFGTQDDEKITVEKND